jgi:hypothetical protein
MAALSTRSLTLAMAASADPPWTTATALRDLGAKFPALAASKTDSSGRLPTGKGVVVAAGTATASDGGDVLVGATDSRQLCFEMNDSSTCQPADLVLKQGMFIIAMDCSAKPVSGQVMGVVAAGIARVAVAGASSVGGASSPLGVVSFPVPGGKIPGLVLDNGQVNPLRVDPSDCRSSSG